MVKLRRTPSEPEWLDVGHGIGLLCQLFDPLADMAAGRAAIRAYQSDGGETAADVEETVALARAAVTDWRGIDEPFSDDALEVMLRQGIVDDDGRAHMIILTFKLAFAMARDRWRAEGEAFAAAPNGTTSAAAGVNSAPAVLQ